MADSESQRHWALYDGDERYFYEWQSAIRHWINCWGRNSFTVLRAK